MLSQIRQSEQGAVAVTGVMEPDDQLRLDQAIHQFHRAVVSDATTLGQVSNCRAVGVREALDCQQCVMLPGGAWLAISAGRICFVFAAKVRLKNPSALCSIASASTSAAQPVRYWLSSCRPI
jgi:hypothetical protein